MKYYIDKIIELSKQAKVNDDIPVGAIVVKDNEIIGFGINTRNVNKDVIGHAEINAIEMACAKIGDWRLDGCIMYVTLSPCMMCTGAIVESRIDKVYYLCNRTNVRFSGEKFINLIKINDRYRCEKYMKILQSFFENKRNRE